MTDKWRRILHTGAKAALFTSIGLLWHAVCAHAATSGWPVDATVTSTTNFLGTTGANGLYWGGVTGLTAHMVGGFEWGRAANTATGAMIGGSALTNANGIATVAGISPGATIHALHHPEIAMLTHHLGRLVA